MPFMATFGAGSVRGFGAVSQLQLAPASPPADPNSVVYSTAGTYTWVCPAGVYKVSIVCVGAGAGGYTSRVSGGGGGGLIYINNIPVSPGSHYTVSVAHYYLTPSTSSFSWGGNTITANRGANPSGGTTSKSGTGASAAVGYTGGNGPNGGGGAAGYAGNGGAGASGTNAAGSAGSGGGGGGGGSGDGSGPPYYGAYVSAGGGGVGLFPTSLTNGAGGTYNSTYPLGGGGGSGGGQGGTGGQGNGFSTDNSGSKLMGQGGTYGGGGGTAPGPPGQGSGGAVRIMWPGDTRQFPLTDAGTP